MDEAIRKVSRKEVKRIRRKYQKKHEKNKASRKKKHERQLLKEKQITNFLECKKSFFGRVKYFFKKDNKTNKLKEMKQIPESEEKSIEIGSVEKIEEKDFYTIEDLLKICETLRKEETKLKNMQMDIKALENRKENLERKIQNATLYINEIESHKKSIFDFWKFTNKDEVTLLNEGELKENEKKNILKREFNYEEDLEEFGKKVDTKQREIFTKNECDAMFALLNDLPTFNILNKEKILKKDINQIEKRLKILKKEYNENVE